MLTDHERIARQQGAPALLRLERALGRLKSVITYMNTGAHPDDEHNGLLAALRLAYGMRIVVACSTRGEGGQNAIGPERGGSLGVLRTREMEEAARILDASVVWLGHGPDDPVHDFGFSKNGDDTLARWGEERIVERLVRAYRSERPDIVSPTFLDVPGQHGHHRAMTRAAIAAFGLAADASAFPEHFALGLSPWQVSKFYLPAWSGAGNSYDDEEPPPPASLVIEPPRRDAATGATYTQIGEWSRAMHRCQGMGVWRDNGRAAWPLHLLMSAGQETGRESDIRDHLPANVGALAMIGGLPASMSDAIEEAQAAIDETTAAFPDTAAIRASAIRAARAIDAALAACPVELRPLVGHRLSRKALELDAVLFEAQGIAARAAAKPRRVAPGSTFELEAFVDVSGVPVEIEPVLGPALRETGRATAEGVTKVALAVDPDAAFTSPYPPTFDPLRPGGELALRLVAEIGGRRVAREIELEEGLLVLPENSVRLDPEAILLNLAQPPREIRVKLEVDGPAAPDSVAFEMPSGWHMAREANAIRLTPPKVAAAGRSVIRPRTGDAAASRVAPISYPHIGCAFDHRPVELPVLAVDAKLPEGVKVAYVGGGNDSVGTWLARLGLAVTVLDRDRFERADLSQFTTIVVGIFAFGTRPDLAAAASKLRSWVEAGGHLVTLYHRPSDGWEPALVPPRRMKIGLPSLRWRVTDPNAPVRTLLPQHPLLTYPNAIGPDDWAGWDKERGLYFASQWDEVYEPLLAMNDPGELPLLGALLSGGIGRGRHTHTALVLHHQLDKLVPGAFRILANLVQKA